MISMTKSIFISKQDYCKNLVARFLLFNQSCLEININFVTETHALDLVQGSIVPHMRQ